MKFRIISFIKSGFLKIIFISAMILSGCPDVKEDPIHPEKPKWVPKSLPEAMVETGIDADNTGKERIVLMWSQNQDEDLAGYEIYRADTSAENTFRKIRYVDILEFLETDTLYYDDSVRNYTDYFYVIKAKDNSENSSPPSDTISYRLINHPDCISPVDSTYTDNFTFRWMDHASNFEFSTEYVIRIEDVETGKTVWTARFTNIWYGFENEEPISMDFFYCNETGPDNLLSCNSASDSLLPGLCRWKIKAISEIDNSTNLDEASGESEWSYFYLE